MAGLAPDAENAGVYRRFCMAICAGGGSSTESLCRMTVAARRARMGAIQNEHTIVVEAFHVAGAVMTTGAVWAVLGDMRRHERGVLAGMAIGARRGARRKLAALRTRMAGRAGQRRTGEIDPMIDKLEIGPSVIEGGSIAEPGRGPTLGRVTDGAIALAKRVAMNVWLGVAGSAGLRRVGRGHVGCMAIGAGDLLVPALKRERGRSVIKSRSLIDTVVAVGTSRAESFDMVGHEGLCAFTMALHTCRRFERERQTGVTVLTRDRGVVVVDDMAREREPEPRVIERAKRMRVGVEVAAAVVGVAGRTGAGLRRLELSMQSVPCAALDGGGGVAGLAPLGRDPLRRLVALCAIILECGVVVEALERLPLRVHAQLTRAEDRAARQPDRDHDAKQQKRPTQTAERRHHRMRRAIHGISPAPK